MAQRIGKQFQPKFTVLPQETKDEIFESVRLKGIYKTANEYAPKVGMHPMALYKALKKAVDNPEYAESGGSEEGNLGYKNPTPPTEKKLSKEEKEFLDKLEKGETSIADVSRLVARRVFERMLKNPDDFKFIDFFRAELIRVKEEENNTKKKIAEDVITRLFAGKLPPRHCPSCGYDLMPELDSKELVEGEIVDEHLPTTGSN